jgi:hypothetical protein
MSPYAQSSDAVPPTQHTVPSDSLASTKTLRIPELLKIILLQVPVQYLTALRPVARAWNDIILEINHIAPATIGHGDENCTCLVNTQACTHTPHYTHRFPIRGNPAFTHTHFHRTTSKDHNGEEILPNTLRHYRGLKLKSRNDTSELDACANQFITDPPVTLVALGNAGVGGTYMQAMLRVPGERFTGCVGQDVLCGLWPCWACNGMS